MRYRSNSVRTGLIAVSVAIALGGCSTKAANSDSGSGNGGDGLKTDVGVTDDTITLGVLTDLSGPYKISGLATSNGNQLWADDVNSRGGICGREVKLDVQESGYKPDNAIPLYEQMRQNDLAMLQLLGSPVLAALKQKLISDNMIAIPSAFTSDILDNDVVMLVGQSYDVEMINGLAYLQQQGKIDNGSKVGHIYLDNEAGKNSLEGAKFYAEQHDLEIVEASVSATDTDMTSVMTKMKSEGVEAILVLSTPAATGSIALQNVAQGLNVPIVGNNPTYAATLLQDEQVTAALDNFLLVNSVAAYASDLPTSKKVVEAYEAAYDEAPEKSVPTGFAFGLAMEQLLQQACDDGDMTREGLIAAKKKLDDVDTQGLTGTLDFSTPGSPSSREAYILRVDPQVPAGLVNVGDLFTSPEAKEYKAPYEK
ncbi:ABC transporter substrate-binding protein [Epidermidibacterium keratini]|uniref:ABC transporter substrate-binding protein n=1 Tax=Epidermidibacterium keratini TaxID=1891644 RepID=A0A7L4YPB5_9ACTN|nr:ABC transporter substrate-binding protein [Epidermidibacterium keratini]QHC00649.1 ABC transporter substrate-binding protein [Epidermidibacterium keratini]